MFVFFHVGGVAMKLLWLEIEGCFVIQNHTQNVWKLFWQRNLEIVKLIFPLDLFCVFLIFVMQKTEKKITCWTSICFRRTKVYKGIVKVVWSKCGSSWTKWLQWTRNGGNVSGDFSFLLSLIVSIVVFK
jgi:hypothetical protein